MVSHYEVLELKRSASEQDIKKAYKRMAMRLHPDKNPEGETMFKKVAEAYDVLGNPGSRISYDKCLEGEDAATFARAGSCPGGGPSSASGATSSSGFPSRTAASQHWGTQAYEDVVRRRSESEAQKHRQTQEFAASNVNFSEWYKQKVEAQQRETAEAEQKQRERQAEQDRRGQAEEEERQRQRDKERMQQAEQERQRQLEQEDAERHRVEAQRRRRAQEERVRRERVEEWTRQKKSEEEDAERSLKELADNRRRLQREKDRLAEEAKEIDPVDAARLSETQRRRGAEAERSLREAESMLVERKRQAEQKRAEQTRREEADRLKERQEREASERMREKMLRAEKEWQNDAEEHERTKRHQASEIARMNRKVMDDALQARLRHEADIKAMREETDKMEREMLAKLELVRQAKREGKALDLHELRLSVDPSPVSAEPERDYFRRGSERSLGSLGATRGSVPDLLQDGYEVGVLQRKPSVPIPVSQAKKPVSESSDSSSPVASSDLDVSPTPSGDNSASGLPDVCMQASLSQPSNSPPSTSPQSWSAKRSARRRKSSLVSEDLPPSPPGSVSVKGTTAPTSPAISAVSSASIARAAYHLRELRDSRESLPSRDGRLDKADDLSSHTPCSTSPSHGRRSSTSHLR